MRTNYDDTDIINRMELFFRDTGLVVAWMNIYSVVWILDSNCNYENDSRIVFSFENDWSLKFEGVENSHLEEAGEKAWVSDIKYIPYDHLVQTQIWNWMSKPGIQLVVRDTNVSSQLNYGSLKIVVWMVAVWYGTTFAWENLYTTGISNPMVFTREADISNISRWNSLVGVLNKIYWGFIDSKQEYSFCSSFSQEVLREMDIYTDLLSKDISGEITPEEKHIFENFDIAIKSSMWNRDSMFADFKKKCIQEGLTIDFPYTMNWKTAEENDLMDERVRAIVGEMRK